MPEVTSQFDAEVADALEATRTFVRVLDLEQLDYLAQRVRTIQEALERHDLKTALYLHWALSRLTGPGSLSDVGAKDDRRFCLACGSWKDRLGKLQLSLKYRFGRPE